MLRVETMPVSVSLVRLSTTFTLPTTTIDTSESGSGSSPTIVSISEAFVQLVSLKYDVSCNVKRR